jgi:ribose transport system ATP-binding protein
VHLVERTLAEDGGGQDAVDLEVRAGEILGIAGLAGSGRTEVLRALLRADHVDGGTVEIFDQRLRARTPKAAINAGLGLIPEDRKSQALFLTQSVRFNISIADLEKVRRAGVVLPGKERSAVSQLINKLRVRTPDTEFTVQNLSGGNQQKAVFARWVHAECKVLLADEPTRGVDVGAKQEIYRLLSELASEGLAIIMVSSELPELLGVAHRIAVMHEGQLVATLEHATATEELIMRHAAGHDAPPPGART